MERYWMKVVVSCLGREGILFKDEKEGDGFMEWRCVEKYMKGCKRVGKEVEVDLGMVSWYRVGG